MPHSQRNRLDLDEWRTFVSEINSSHDEKTNWKIETPPRFRAETVPISTLHRYIQSHTFHNPQNTRRLLPITFPAEMPRKPFIAHIFTTSYRAWRAQKWFTFWENTISYTTWNRCSGFMYGIPILNHIRWINARNGTKYQGVEPRYYSVVYGWPSNISSFFNNHKIIKYLPDVFTSFVFPPFFKFSFVRMKIQK